MNRAAPFSSTTASQFRASTLRSLYEAGVPLSGSPAAGLILRGNSLVAYAHAGPRCQLRPGREHGPFDVAALRSEFVEFCSCAELHPLRLALTSTWKNAVTILDTVVDVESALSKHRKRKVADEALTGALLRAMREMHRATSAQRAGTAPLRGEEDAVLARIGARIERCREALHRPAARSPRKAPVSAERWFEVHDLDQLQNVRAARHVAELLQFTVTSPLVSMSPGAQSLIVHATVPAHRPAWMDSWAMRRFIHDLGPVTNVSAEEWSIFHTLRRGAPRTSGADLLTTAQGVLART